MYHIVERKFCRCGRFPPEVRTAIPVDGRFEHIVLSCHATSDHGIIWIEKEAGKALELMKESGGGSTATTAPKVQRFERKQTLEKEHKDALERAVSLKVPHAVNSMEDEEASHQDDETQEPPPSQSGESSTKTKPSSGRTNWDEVVETLFHRSESGDLRLRKEVATAATAADEAHPQSQ